MIGLAPDFAYGFDSCICNVLHWLQMICVFAKGDVINFLSDPLRRQVITEHAVYIHLSMSR